MINEQQIIKMKPNKNIDKQQWTTTNTTPLNRLRSSDFKFDQRCSDLYLLRNSFSSLSIRNNHLIQQNDFRHSNLNSVKKKQMETLKQTLDKLQDKVNAVKQQLQIPATSMKKKGKTLVHFQQEHEQKETQKQQSTINPTDSTVTLKNSDKKLAALITNIPKPANFKPVYTNPYSPRRHTTYYVSQAIRAINEKNSLVVEHINGSIKIIKQCQPQEIPQMSQIMDKRLNLKKSQKNKKKKTLVLDLDQTLIHCVDHAQLDADLRLSIRLQGDNSSHQFGINIRPYALTFLKKMSKKFEIIIFTASQQQYADSILDQLDPDNQLFDYRLYRQHCYVLENELHVKDLRVINRSLSDMVLVDNAAYSYAFQLENGIPILPYYEGSDYQLAALEHYLDEIDRCADVRELNKATFKFHHYSKFCSGQQLIEQLYMNKNH